MTRMTKWEYFVAPLLEHNPGEILNNFGEDGWELVTILAAADSRRRRLDGRVHEATDLLACGEPLRRSGSTTSCSPSADLDASAARLWEEHGLRFAPGGRHPRWGTANMIAPLGSDYVELLGVVDEAVGSTSVLGRTLLELVRGGDRWFSVCLADDDIDATAARLGLTSSPAPARAPTAERCGGAAPGSRSEATTLWLPFFISWDVPAALHPGAAPAEHRVPVEGIAWAEVGGDEARLRGWLGGADVPIRVVDGDTARACGGARPPRRRARSCLRSVLAERLGQIGDQVVDVLDPDREADELRRHLAAATPRRSRASSAPAPRSTTPRRRATRRGRTARSARPPRWPRPRIRPRRRPSRRTPTSAARRPRGPDASASPG